LGCARVEIAFIAFDGHMTLDLICIPMRMTVVTWPNFLSWLKKSDERRRSPRRVIDCLEAVYWEGAANCLHRVRDINLDGASIETQVNWYEGTMIRMTLRDSRHEGSPGQGGRFVVLWCQVVRSTVAAFCVEFLFGGRSERRQVQQFLEQLRMEQRG
jgi:hypothetical protein